jgi:hypothetical protein
MPEQDDELVIGAVAIAKKAFDDSVKPRQVYRLAETLPDLPFFKLLNKLACYRGRMRAAVAQERDDPSLRRTR